MEHKLRRMIDEVLKIYLDDTSTMLEQVVSEDVNDPETSAITTYKRYQLYLSIMSELNRVSFADNVEELIYSQAYDKGTYDEFMLRRARELPIYHGDVEWDWNKE